MRALPRFRMVAAAVVASVACVCASCGSDSNPVDPDSLPPFVGWMVPAVTGAADTVFLFDLDTTTVYLNAGDDGGVISAVRVYLDGAVVATLTSAPYRTVISLAGIRSNRSARVWATASDPTGKVGSTADTLRFIHNVPPDTAVWTPLSPSRSPAARDGFSWDVDPAADRALLFGGYSAAELASKQDLWSFDLSADQWDSLAPSNTPPLSRTRHASGLSAGRLVIFGGEHMDLLGGVDSVLEDYSVLDVTSLSWNSGLFNFELRPAVAMSAVAFGGQLFVYGGTDRPLDGTAQEWFWRYSMGSGTWQSLAPAPNLPGPLVLSFLAANAEDGDLFLYGGTAGRIVDPPTVTSNFRLDLASLTWASTAAPGPPALKDGGLICDTALHRILLWGGRDGGGGSPVEVWEFSLGANAWRQVPVAGTPPAGRTGHRLVYDAARQRLLMFGGLVSGAWNAETWELAW